MVYIYHLSVYMHVYLCAYMYMLIPIQSHELLECDYYRGGSKGVLGSGDPLQSVSYSKVNATMNYFTRAV